MSDTNAKILLVDDKPDKLLSLEAVLEDLGTEMVRAYSGRDALRNLLAQDFAVILLDVNMPGMDGFETASLIRQRPATRDLPIIFVTAYGDETHIAQGYLLGAVDYIHTPVVPEVLRSKVGVFVELFKKTQQVQRQAESLRRRAAQLQRLAEASVAISSAPSIDKTLQAVTDAAREVIASHQAITLFTDPRPGRSNNKPHAFASYSPKYEAWKSQPLHLDSIVRTVVFRSRTATRLTEAELLDHPDWEIVKQVRIPPIEGGMLAAPLCGRDGTQLGVIYLCDRGEGSFNADDEVIAVQLAQLASIAIENLLYSEEREANRIKDEFLSTLSHELRTPLNAIVGWTQVLRMESPQGDLAHGLEVIERNALAQSKLVEDMLDVSRIASGKLRLQRKHVSVAPIVKAAADGIRPNAEKKGVKIELSLEAADDAHVHGDADRLQQVVWNLLSNSVKFTPKDGRIDVRVACAGDDVCIRIADTGDGISASFLPFVFDRFRQADSSSTRSHGGLGIGLAIVRQIVELHGGTVSAESPGEGRGATFEVRLPLHVSEENGALPPAGANGTEPEIPSSEAQGLDGTGIASLESLRVLFVDDAEDTLQVLAQVLRRADADVVTAPSAEAAISVFHKFRPDVLITDIAMPGQDGYQLLRTIRELGPANGGDVPAIALTAFAREEDRIRAITAGFQMHLKKPVDPATLIAAVAHVHRDRKTASAFPAQNAETIPSAT